ncbi:TIGR00730 family Rossman fold protein [Zavarzinia compransoris]|uniref:Cytokinin riboside 5'-monophosphate phosphoribohydrolase n=1 Tax=Zavarzinia compransoris TaxID=1264899 RepID=A0A317E8I8_9PROT|nr:TIGR00730 family Rossman fold protein [Zavarzinia compransoris]PWR23417.1 TIGR00730 family Rossman fold protein [Zavarzinia compransoris]
MPVVNSLCVFCGASTPPDIRFLDAAGSLGRTLAAEGIELVYGGGALGLMGTIARAARDAGGKVTGIIPTFLTKLEEKLQGISETVEVETMHQRKRLMFERSDAFIVLPGGMGTLDETVEMITWAQLQLHRKPILLVDYLGYWQPFISLVEHVIGTGFARPNTRDFITIVPDVEAILPTLEKLTIAGGPATMPVAE